MHDKISFWQRIRIRRRISILDDHTLKELWTFRLSKLGLVIVMTLLFAITLACLSLIVIYTPIRNVLPGYNQNLRNQLLTESVRLDSLSHIVEVQKQYINVIRDITAGEIKMDSVQSLDSMQLVFQDELLQAKQETTEDFVNQYEQKEKDNMLLFDAQDVTPVLTVFRPVDGLVLQSFDPKNKLYGVQIQPSKKTNVCAALAGSIVYVHYDLSNTYTVVMQHTNYVSIYRNLEEVKKPLGASLRVGETIGFAAEGKPLQFELWKDGKVMNPEEVISFR